MDMKQRLQQLNGEQLQVLKNKLGGQDNRLGADKPVAANNDPIAIVGVSFRFPGGAKDLDSFWDILANGKDVVQMQPFPRVGDSSQVGGEQQFFGGYIDDIDAFDAGFFNISPREAELIDPQQRLFMQIVWQAIEDAGYAPGLLRGSKTGIYVGICNYDYNEMLQTQRHLSTSVHSALGNSPSLLANRVSFFHDFHGPSETIDTACSGSLVALHRAVRAVRAGECDQAIVGGVNLLLSTRLFDAFTEAGMLSPSGSCKTFDASADGYARGEGIAAIMLKPLSNAQSDGDHIYALIRGTAVNHGGKANSLTAPNPAAQAALLVSAYSEAGVAFDSISYVEAHGTGTELGDPLEVDALQAAAKKLSDRPLGQWRCGLGSVKSNIGHLEAAAGLSGLIKVITCMANRQLPPTVHFKTLNPHIDLQDSPFYIVDKLQAWESSGHDAESAQPRRAGISSFGFGGANAHAILEAYPDKAKRRQIDLQNLNNRSLVFLSAKNGERLRAVATELYDYLNKHPDMDASGFAELVYTLQIGREALDQRLTIVCKDRRELVRKLEQFLAGEQSIENLFVGNRAKEQGYERLSSMGADMRRSLVQLLHTNQLDKLALLVAKGFNFDWQLLYQSDRPRRISLPTYPFAKERYWYETRKTGSDHSLTHAAGEFLADKDTDNGTVCIVSDWQDANLVSATSVNSQTPNLKFILIGQDAERIQSIKNVFPDAQCFQLETRVDLTVSLQLADFGSQLIQHVVDVFTAVKETISGKKREKQLFVVLYSAEADETFDAGYGRIAAHTMTGLFKSAELEYPSLKAKAIAVSSEIPTALLLENIKAEVCYENYHSEEIRYSAANRRQRYTRCETRLAEAKRPYTDFTQNNPVYWISGGIGKLGLIFARHLASRQQARIILSGRAALNAEIAKHIDALSADGLNVAYLQCDVADMRQVERAFAEIKTRHGGLNGIMHCAGSTRDGYLIKKDAQQIRSVLLPKLSGMLNLDLVSKDERLDFFVGFSSIAGVTGSIGQADYAAGNAFIDAYCIYRNRLVEQGLRRGRSVAIAWPLWSEGGMQIGEQNKQFMYHTLGMTSLQTVAGLALYDEIMASSQPQLLVVAGDPEKISQRLLDADTPSQDSCPPSMPQQSVDRHVDDQQLKQDLLRQLTGLLSEAAKTPVEKIDVDEPFEIYGIDSIMIGQLNQRFEPIFGSDLSKTLLYEYKTLSELSVYFFQEYRQQCLQWCGLGDAENVQQQDAEEPGQNIDRVSNTDCARPAVRELQADESIAIIGMAGRYPKAADLDEFWQRLSDADNCITEIPAERWDQSRYFYADKDEAIQAGGSYSKWGGFISGFNEFDCLLFNISPREALNIDPQERKFLECCWQTIEDAGYTRQALAAYSVGVFAGITKTGFDLLGAEAESNLQFSPQTSFGSLANRVSYVFDFHGPSMPVDTMCSSSLTAIHLACENIRQGNCDVALAGGVNLYLHPQNYNFLCRMRMLADNPNNRSFGLGGNGFVPGEGVGAVLLKPLSQAEADGDYIYGLVRGSSINHGGRTSGYTVPNPNAQCDLIARAMDKAGVTPRHISYIEAHGTGTELGDPIEISGLTQAFRKQTQDRQFCAIGSIKSNIGHLEAAAGIAGISKVLLQFKYRQRVPSLHADTLNPNINFKATPFKVQQRLEAWPRPTIDGVEVKRLAGISSFGAGGANAHVILEEYDNGDHAGTSSDANAYPLGKYLILLSARDRERLLAYAVKLECFISRQAQSEPLTGAFNMLNMAYTLGVGREAMEYRAALLVTNLSDLQGKLRELIAGESISGESYQSHDVGSEPVCSTAELDAMLEPPLQEEQLSQLAAAWVSGTRVDWQRFYAPYRPSRIPLPAYAFAKKIIWHKTSPTAQIATQAQRGPQVVTDIQATSTEIKPPASIEQSPQCLSGKIRLSEPMAFSETSYTQDIEPGKANREKIKLSMQGKTDVSPQSSGLQLLEVKRTLTRQLAEMLFVEADDIGEDNKFVDLGLDSIVGVEWVKLINQTFAIKMSATKLYDYPSISDLALFVVEQAKYTENVSPVQSTHQVALAPLQTRHVEVQARIPTPEPQRDAIEPDPAQLEKIRQTLKSQLADMLFLETNEIVMDRNFVDHGLDSIVGVEWVKLINKTYNTKLSATRLYDYPTIHELSQFIVENLQTCDDCYTEREIPDTPVPVAQPVLQQFVKHNAVAEQSVRQPLVQPAASVDHRQLKSVTDRLRGQLADILFLDDSDIADDRNFVDLGLDSIVGVEWVKNINREFGVKIPATKLYDYPCLAELAEYLSAANTSLDVADAAGAAAAAIITEVEHQRSRSTVTAMPVQQTAPRQVDSVPAGKMNPGYSGKIAIVGMSGNYPGAKDKETFWKNLANGVSSVIQVPDNRWDVNKYFDAAPGKKDKIYSKWLGALSDIEEFDPLFFNLSPLEAECMDPQQRLFLQESWKALEDAGYSKEKLQNVRCGTYVGIMANDYWQVLGKNPEYMKMAQTMMGNSNAIAAARLAYFLNLKGPAIALDTACSSSLVASHLAYQALQAGDIDMALVGGVTLYLSVDGFKQMCEANMLSPQGKCFCFDDRADGFVPGEAAATVVLKRLEDAETDNDHIYGVIVASGINQDGKTNGITAPSVNSQIELQSGIYDRFGINPESISYVETHGTGTKLGDPIEMEALSSVFRKYTDKKQYCAIGSVKSNLGHTSAAAGVVSMHKVLLAMKHDQLPPSLNYEKGNEHIDFENSPFYVNTQLAPWPGDKAHPRRAAISSFGFSGTNAHLVIEEYRSPVHAHAHERGANTRAVLVPLSARKKSNLMDMARQLSNHLSDLKQSGAEVDIRDIAYTLQTGRQAMDCRVAFLVQDCDELNRKLSDFCDDKKPGDSYFYAQASKEKDNVKLLSSDDDLKEAINKWVLKGKLDLLADVWVKGLEPDWTLFDSSKAATKLPLPGYRFSRERYWVPMADTNIKTVTREERGASVTVSVNKLHPLLHENSSNFDAQKFTSVFDGDEQILKDHVIDGNSILPGVAYLEMARKATELSTGNKVTGFSHVVWIEPLVVAGRAAAISIWLEPVEHGAGFKIKNDEQDGPTRALYAKGQVSTLEWPIPHAERIDLAQLAAQAERPVAAEDFYRSFSRMGFRYGDSFQLIKSLQSGPELVIAKFDTEGRDEYSSEYELNPAILDASLQASMLLNRNDAEPRQFVPFSVNEVKLYRPLPKQGYALVKRIDGDRHEQNILHFEVTITDESGGICVTLHDFVVKSFSSTSQKIVEASAASAVSAKQAVKQGGGEGDIAATDGGEVIYASPTWLESDAVIHEQAEQSYRTSLVLVGLQERLAYNIKDKTKFTTEIIAAPILPNTAKNIHDTFLQVFNLIKSLLQEKHAETQKLLVVVPAVEYGHIYATLGGLLKTANLENAKVQGKVIIVEDDKGIGVDLYQNIIKRENLAEWDGVEIRYNSDGERRVRQLVELDIPSYSSADAGWQAKSGDVYWLTGGLGGLGEILARELCKTPGVSIVLSGRSPLSEPIQQKLTQLNQAGEASIRYQCADVSRKEEMARVMQDIKQQEGRLTGIIHSAGVINDAFIINKSEQEIDAVFKAKLYGTFNLDEVSKNEPLEFIMLFSSVAGVMGNIGQADYSAANAFLDAFATYRNDLAAHGKRQGKTISINWPLWRDGGMGIDKQIENWLEINKGVKSLLSEQGIVAFKAALSHPIDNQLLVVAGERDKVVDSMGIHALRRGIPTAHVETSSASVSVAPAAEYKPQPKTQAQPLQQGAEDIRDTLLGICEDILKIDRSEIDADTELSEYGIDSILMMKVLTRLEEKYSEAVEPAAIIDNPTINGLAQHLIDEGIVKTRIEDVADRAVPVLSDVQNDQVESTGVATQFVEQQVIDGVKSRRFAGAESSRSIKSNKVAVIGISCRLPKSSNPDAFWDNLVKEADLISEVDADRWDAAEVYSPNKNEPHRTYTNKGGFLENVAEFDSAFFGISEVEADSMDPQHRIILELAQELFDDAGYEKSELNSRRISVILGAKENNYIRNNYNLMPQETVKHAIVNTIGNMMAARVSDFYNLTGVSKTLDTACSSSLVAVHDACQSILNGDSEMSVAGGIFLIMDAFAHIGFSNAGVLSDDGKSYVFDERAKGFVLGEGAGLVLLKDYDAAVRDNDNIQAVILGSAVNNDGRTMGLTVPNQQGQSAVIEDALERSGVNPAMISYLEAHGTGTLLGDPIEIKAATQVYRKYTNNSQYCALGSVKSNVGHTMTAAGVVSLLKVILSLKNKKIPATLNCSNPHPRFKFAESPFYPNTKLTDWKAIEGRRIAAISSLGFGGTNCHMIVEEAN